MFSPSPRVSSAALDASGDPGAHALILDDFLLEPQQLVDLAGQHRDAFAMPTRNAFPGPELPLPDGVMAGWLEVVLLRVRQALGLRRVLSAHGRLSIATLQPQELGPLQRLCHRDRLDTTADQVPLASVVYLFRDPSLGGTAFYRPRQTLADTDALMQRVAAMDHDTLSAELGTPPGYLTSSNRWFERTAVIPAAFNRAIFYRGDRFHTSHIEHPEHLSADPARGRLTMNGFFVCRPAAA